MNFGSFDLLCVYSWVARDRHHFLKSKTKKPQKLLSSSGIRGGKFICVNNFSAQYLFSSKNRHISNFRVMAVRDIKAMNVFVEEYIIYNFRSPSIRKMARLNVCLISSDNQ